MLTGAHEWRAASRPRICSGTRKTVSETARSTHRTPTHAASSRVAVRFCRNRVTDWRSKRDVMRRTTMLLALCAALAMTPRRSARLRPGKSTVQATLAPTGGTFLSQKIALTVCSPAAAARPSGGLDQSDIVHLPAKGPPGRAARRRALNRACRAFEREVSEHTPVTKKSTAAGERSEPRRMAFTATFTRKAHRERACELDCPRSKEACPSSARAGKFHGEAGLSEPPPAAAWRWPRGSSFSRHRRERRHDSAQNDLGAPRRGRPGRRQDGQEVSTAQRACCAGRCAALQRRAPTGSGAAPPAPRSTWRAFSRRTRSFRPAAGWLAERGGQTS